MQYDTETPAFNPEAAMAARLQTVPFSGIRKVFDKVKELETAGRDVIHWQIGRPDFDTPEHIKQATIDSLNRGEVHYAPNLGTLELRRAIGAPHDLGQRREGGRRKAGHRHGGRQRGHHGGDARLRESRRRGHRGQSQLAPLQILRLASPEASRSKFRPPRPTASASTPPTWSAR